jgi:hypothetical protein
MEQILLGEAAMGTEVAFGKGLKSRQGHTAFIKVVCSECAGHPDVDRKGPRLIAREQQDTIGDLTSHAWQNHEEIPSFSKWQFAQVIEFETAIRDLAGCVVQVACPETHAAVAQSGFASTGYGTRCGTCEGSGIPSRNNHGLAESLAEVLVDLSDLNNLFGGRQEKRRQARPKLNRCLQVVG